METDLITTTPSTALVFIFVINLISWTISKLYPMKTLGWYKQAINDTVPPGYIFSIVWTTLYSLVAVVLYRIWTRPESQVRTYFLTSLIALILTTYTFTPLFVTRNFLWSNAVVLTSLLLSFLIAFGLYRYDYIASLLLIPLIVWLIQALIFSSQIGASISIGTEQLNV